MKSNSIANIKTIALTAAVTAMFVWAYTPAHASTASANHGHHGGGNNGAVGAAAGAFGGSSSSAAAAGSSASGGNGGRFAFEDNYQPWPQAEMARFEKPKFIPYAGE